MSTMKQKISQSLIVYLLFSVGVLSQAVGQTEQGVQILTVDRGTLIIGLPSKTGLLICADKRTYDNLRGDLDSATKINQVTPTVALALTGTTAFLDILTNVITNQKSLRFAFTPEEVTKEYIEKNNFEDTERFWQGLGVILKERFEKYIYARPYTLWPDTGDPPDNVLFQLVFFHLDSVRKPAVVFVRFCYIKKIPPFISILKTNVRDTNYNFILPMVFGNTSVYDELRSGNDKRFDEARSSKHIKIFLGKEIPVEPVTVDTALDFARKLIKITSEMTHLIEKSTSNVGPTADCAILDYKEGFKWLVTNTEFTE